MNGDKFISYIMLHIVTEWQRRKNQKAGFRE